MKTKLPRTLIVNGITYQQMTSQGNLTTKMKKISSTKKFLEHHLASIPGLYDMFVEPLKKAEKINQRTDLKPHEKRVEVDKILKPVWNQVPTEQIKAAKLTWRKTSSLKMYFLHPPQAMQKAMENKDVKEKFDNLKEEFFNAGKEEVNRANTEEEMNKISVPSLIPKFDDISSKLENLQNEAEVERKVPKSKK